MPRQPRGSRQGDIPGGFILKWQNSKAQSVVRRPVTACQMCRIAKVKCNGKQDCGRCSSRGLVCNYKETDKREVAASLNDANSSNMATQPMPDQVSLDLNSADVMDRYSMDEIFYEGDHVIDPMVNWSTQQTLDNIDWAVIDPSLIERSFSNDLPMPSDVDVLSSAVRSSHQNIPSPDSLSNANVEGATDITPVNGLAQMDANQLSSLPRCVCREKLTMLVPQVNRAIQAKQFDEVFKGTQQVVDSFQNTVECTKCNITCIELICIMSMFQQTDAYFEYIARADLGTTMNMDFAGSAVPINDPKLRAILVISLIYQATSVLDAIGLKGQNMIKALCSPSALARTNIAYLNSAIRDFRTTLGTIADTAEKAGSQTT